MLVTAKNLHKNSINKPIYKLTINDINFTNILILGWVTDITYVDEITGITHTIR